MKYRKYYKTRRDSSGRVVQRKFRNPLHNFWLNVWYWLNPEQRPKRERFK